MVYFVYTVNHLIFTFSLFHISESFMEYIFCCVWRFLLFLVNYAVFPQKWKQLSPLQSFKPTIICAFACCQIRTRADAATSPSYAMMSSSPTALMWLPQNGSSNNTYKVFVVVVLLVFYETWTLFRSFQAWSVHLATLFLGKPPRQFTST